MNFFFEKVKNYVQVCSENGLERFVHPIKYEEKVKIWEKKRLLFSLKNNLSRTACLIKFDKVDKTAFNLSRWKFSPFFIGKSNCYKKGCLRARRSRQDCQNCILCVQTDILGGTVRSETKKKIFLSFFPTFRSSCSNFRIHFGRPGKRFPNCWWNWIPLVRTKVLLGKNFCRSFHVYKTISCWSEKLWDLGKKTLSVRLSFLHFIF